MEIALFGVPMVIIYKAAPLTYAIARRVVNVEHVGICNIIAGERVVPELLQGDAEPVGIAAEIARYLSDHHYSRTVSDKLLQVRKMLGEPGAPARVASIAMQLLQS
jgi:lipid-A-disaccharide synthase